mgnify:CR=1 FL=1
MNSLTRLAITLSLIGLTCSLPITVMATTDAQASTKISKATQQKATFLFVLRADTGSIAKTDAGYTLTLKGMDDKVLYFSDRPVRKAGFITVTQFMNDWAKGNNSFQANPPNAAIVHAALKTNGKGFAQAISVELKNPIATTDGWVFHLTDLQGKISVGDYDRISIFVDGFSPASSYTEGYWGGQQSFGL